MNTSHFCRIHRRDRLPGLNGLRGIKIRTLEGARLAVCHEPCVSSLCILSFAFLCVSEPHVMSGWWYLLLWPTTCVCEPSMTIFVIYLCCRCSEMLYECLWWYWMVVVMIIVMIEIYCMFVFFLDRGQLIMNFCRQDVHALPCALTMAHGKVCIGKPV